MTDGQFIGLMMALTVGAFVVGFLFGGMAHMVLTARGLL